MNQYRSTLAIVTKWATSPARSCEGIALRLDYLLPNEETGRSQSLMLSPEQALAIAHDLTAAVKALGIN